MEKKVTLINVNTLIILIILMQRHNFFDKMYFPKYSDAT